MRLVSYNLSVLLILFALLLQSLAPNGLREGLLALNRGDLAAARGSLEDVSRREPENALVWAALAQVYFKSSEKEAALEAARKAERFGPDNAAIQHALAMFYSGEGEPGKAAHFERRFAASPAADDQAAVRAARLFLSAGDAQAALDTALAALAQKDRAGLHHVAGLAYAALKQPEKSVDHLRTAVRMEPRNEDFTFDLAQGLLRDEQFAEASTALEHAVQSFPESAQIRLTLGVAYYGLRRFPEAVRLFLETIAMAPDVEQPYIFLGRMLDQAGDSLPTIQARLEAFRSRHPDNYWGSFLVAKALTFSGGTAAQIEPLLRETIAKNGDLWEAHAELGDLLNRKRDYAGAALEYERSAKLNPNESSIPFRLARVYDRLHEPEKAAAQRDRHQSLLSQPKAGMGAQKQ